MRPFYRKSLEQTSVKSSQNVVLTFKFCEKLSKRCFYELLTLSWDSMNATESLKITQPSHQRKFLPYCKANLWNRKEKYVSFVLAFFSKLNGKLDVQMGSFATVLFSSSFVRTLQKTYLHV